MDRFIVKEPRVVAGYPQGNEMNQLPANARNGNIISPENVYFGGYPPNFHNQQGAQNMHSQINQIRSQSGLNSPQMAQLQMNSPYMGQPQTFPTASGNKVSRQTVLCGSQNIVLHGKVIVQSDAMIRGDLANVKTGRFCIISKGSVIRPPFKKFSKGVAFFPLQMGDHVFVGENTVVNAAVVGSYVYIGKNVVIGRRCVLKDCCMIEDNSVLPAETVVPSFARYSGSPARLITTLPEATPDLMTEFTKSYYQHFLPTSN